MVKYICEDLRKRIFASVNGVCFDDDFSLSAHTTIGVGGRAAAFFPDSFDKCRAYVPNGLKEFPSIKILFLPARAKDFLPL